MYNAEYAKFVSDNDSLSVFYCRELHCFFWGGVFAAFYSTNMTNMAQYSAVKLQCNFAPMCTNAAEFFPNLGMILHKCGISSTPMNLGENSSKKKEWVEIQEKRTKLFSES
jgi:hypothetical protein